MERVWKDSKLRNRLSYDSLKHLKSCESFWKHEAGRLSLMKVKFVIGWSSPPFPPQIVPSSVLGRFLLQFLNPLLASQAQHGIQISCSDCRSQTRSLRLVCTIITNGYAFQVLEPSVQKPTRMTTQPSHSSIEPGHESPHEAEPRGMMPACSDATECDIPEWAARRLLRSPKGLAGASLPRPPSRRRLARAGLGGEGSGDESSSSAAPR